MTDYLSASLDDEQMKNFSALALAHVGDSVYELLVRTWLCTHGKITSKDLHRSTISYVRASAQAAAVEKISGVLTDEEQAVYRRGRNAKVHTVPKHAELSDYHAATGIEALFGWLWLKGRKDRINTLFSLIMEEQNAP